MAAHEWLPTGIAGALMLAPQHSDDERGEFVKTYHADWFKARGLEFALREEFFSRSRRGVIRGMHVQTPPFQGAKLVTCLEGSVLDVLLDLRVGPEFGKVWSVGLSAANRRVVYIPAGVAHGFVALGEETTVHYKTTSVFDAAHDCGVRWDSFGFGWPVSNPVLSPRDRTLPALNDFESPFK